MKTCPFCKRTDLHDEATRCPHCGGNVGQHEMYRSEVRVPWWGWLLGLLALVAAGALAWAWLNAPGH